MQDVEKKKRVRSRFRIGALFLVLVVVSTCRPVIMHADISGVVVDGETNAPLGGVVVVAIWDLEAFHPGSWATFEIKETKTNDSGSFTIAGWGPKLNWRFLYAHLDGSSPEFIVVKNGYRPLFKRNIDYSGSLWFYETADILDGQTLTLAPFLGTPNEYIDANREVEIRIRRQLEDPECGWKAIPSLLLELYKADLNSLDSGDEYPATIIAKIPPRDCGHPKRFLETYGD